MRDVTGKIDPGLIDYLVDIRTRLDLPEGVTFEILSGYRTPATNAMLARHSGNVAIESLHMRGWAVDFRIAHVDGRAICEIAKTMQRGGVAFIPRPITCMSISAISGRGRRSSCRQRRIPLPLRERKRKPAFSFATAELNAWFSQVRGA